MIAAFPREAAARLIEIALDEDLADGTDVTTMATIPADQEETAEVVARGPGVVAGVEIVAMVFDAVAERLGLPSLVVDPLVADGATVVRGETIARLRGNARTMLIGERTMLNILCRTSAVATHTRRWADELDGTGASVLDTRKTTPGMRALEKFAVTAGGGTNKRMGLYDTAMVKDNHKLAAGGLTEAIAAIRRDFPGVPIEVEVTTLSEALETFDTGVRFIMCDNFDPPRLAETVSALRSAAAAVGESVEIEATGGLSLEVAREFALTGVDYLSVGGLTHSSPIVDIALDLVEGSRFGL